MAIAGKVGLDLSIGEPLIENAFDEVVGQLLSIIRIGGARDGVLLDAPISEVLHECRAADHYTSILFDSVQYGLIRRVIDQYFMYNLLSSADQRHCILALAADHVLDRGE